MRQAEFAHGDLDFDTRIVDIADHLDDAGNRLRITGRLRNQFRIDDLARPGITGRTLDQNVMDNAFVFRCNEPDAVFIDQAADNMRMGAGQYRHDKPLGTPPLVDIEPHEPAPCHCA